MKGSNIERGEASPLLTFFAIAALAAILPGRSLATAAPAADPEGRVPYLTHCASCHGHEGRGDGPDANVFTARPRNLREGFLEKYSTGDLVRRVREGTPLQLLVDLPALKVRANEVNALVNHLKRLPEVDWEATADGWALYTDRCAACHGRYGRPSEDLPSGVKPPRDLSDPAFQRSVTGSELAEVVRHGRVSMPALTPRIPQRAGRPLAAFVRVLAPGFELYSRYCAGCHGDDGLGARNPPGSLGMPAVKFDRAYFARADHRKRLANTVWHMYENEKPAMPHYRWTLTDSEARAIVDYLKQLN